MKAPRALAGLVVLCGVFTADAAQDEATGWQRESRQKLLPLMMCGQTPESVPLKPQVLRREEVPAGGYVVEEFTLQALPDRRVHVWMAVPRQPRGKVGAVLAINGHGPGHVPGAQRASLRHL